MSLIFDENDFYESIEIPSFVEIKIKNSKFLGASFPINSKEEAEEILEKARKKYYDANHNCYAYSLGCTNEQIKYSDDGEPNGTAGKPILQAINHFKLKNVLVIVTRYFGGTKLGVGPLGRAYYDTALEVLSQSGKRIYYFTSSLKFSIDYSEITIIKRAIDKYNVKLAENYTDTVVFDAEILTSQIDKCKSELIAITNGKIAFQSSLQ
jgi:uncharacterized YigZ family protein